MSISFSLFIAVNEALFFAKYKLSSCFIDFILLLEHFKVLVFIFRKREKIKIAQHRTIPLGNGEWVSCNIGHNGRRKCENSLNFMKIPLILHIN